MIAEYMVIAPNAKKCNWRAGCIVARMSKHPRHQGVTVSDQPIQNLAAPRVPQHKLPVCSHGAPPVAMAPRFDSVYGPSQCCLPGDPSGTRPHGGADPPQKVCQKAPPKASLARLYHTRAPFHKDTMTLVLFGYGGKG